MTEGELLITKTEDAIAAHDRCNLYIGVILVMGIMLVASCIRFMEMKDDIDILERKLNAKENNNNSIHDRGYDQTRTNPKTEGSSRAP